MQLYLIRHGDAIDAVKAGISSDDERWLTDAGREEVAWTARILKKLDAPPDLVLSSPLVRARQTAEIVCEIAGPASGPHLTEHLVHGGSFGGILHEIHMLGSPGRVALTGHMPGIGRMVGWLCWNNSEAGVHMRTGGVARVDLPGDRLAPGWGDLRWLLPPKIAHQLLGS